MRHDIWFSKSTFCSIDINIRREDKGRDQIIKICKCLVLVYDGRQSKGKIVSLLNCWVPHKSQVIFKDTP